MIEGLWQEIVGSKCILRAFPVGYGHHRCDDDSLPDTFTTDQVFTIEAVYHRVTKDGKIWPTYKLAEIQSRLFRPDEILIQGICQEGLAAGDLCGEFYA
jgi:hypothetical protein